jgi:hypothetical protein
VGEASIGVDHLWWCVAGLVERDEHPWDNFAQTPVLSVGEDGGIKPGLGRSLFVMVRGTRIDGDIENGVGWRFVVFDGASSSAFGINAEVDLAALS